MASNRGGDRCLFYAAGPGDVVTTFGAWSAGQDDPHQVAVTYSGQFFALCRELDVRGVAVSFNPRVDSLRTDQFFIENRPKGPPLTGLAYHRQQFAYARSLIATATKEKATVLIAAESTGHLFALDWFAPKKLALIPTLHCTLWPKFSPLDGKQRLLNFFNRRLFTQKAQGILCISEDIRRQLRLIAKERLRPVHRFMPCYQRDTFASVPEPEYPKRNFHILFAGRLEENKGIFDLLEICAGLRTDLAKNVVWDIAGDGSCEDELRRQVAQRGLDANFRVHGYCHRPKMLKLIERSHAFIVPTRTEFEEGFNKVVAEAILNNRPVLTSAVCPAIDDVRPAVVEARPNTVGDYIAGVERLVEDPDFYQEKLAACKAQQEQFYTPANSWRAKLKLAVEQSEQC